MDLTRCTVNQSKAAIVTIYLLKSELLGVAVIMGKRLSDRLLGSALRLCVLQTYG